MVVTVNQLNVTNNTAITVEVDDPSTISLFHSKVNERPLATPGGCGGVAIHQFNSDDSLLDTDGDPRDWGLAALVATVLGISNWTGVIPTILQPDPQGK